MRGLVAGGIGPFGVHGVGQGHVADTQREELIECGQAVVDHVPALDAHQHRDLLGFFRGADFVGGGAQHQIIRITRYGLAHRGDLILSAADGGGAGNGSGNPDRKENRVEATFAHARDVDAAIGVARGEIKFRVEQSLGGVVMSVDHDRTEMQVVGLLRDFRLRIVLLRAIRENRQSSPQQDAGQKQTSTKHYTPKFPLGFYDTWCGRGYEDAEKIKGERFSTEDTEES